MNIALLLRAAVVAPVMIAALTASSAHAQAFTVVDNLLQATANQTILNEGELLGQFIRTGTTPGNLESITLPLQVLSAPSTVSLTLRAYNQSSFGVILATLAPQTVVSTDSVNTTFVPVSSFALASNTAYWVVASNSGGTVRWAYAAPFTTGGEGSLTNNPTAAASRNGGSSFSGSYSTSPQKLQILAFVVPEAGTGALLGLAVPLAGTVVAMRRRKPVR